MKMKSLLFSMLLAGLLVSSCTSKRNSVQTLKISDAQASRYGKKIITSIPVFFDEGDGEIVKAGLVSRRSSVILRNEEYSRTSGIEQGCHRAFAAAVERLQMTAKNRAQAKLSICEARLGKISPRGRILFFAGWVGRESPFIFPPIWPDEFSL